jgi:hypothetical protein
VKLLTEHLKAKGYLKWRGTGSRWALAASSWQFVSVGVLKANGYQSATFVVLAAALVAGIVVAVVVAKRR